MEVAGEWKRRWATRKEIGVLVGGRVVGRLEGGGGGRKFQKKIGVKGGVEKTMIKENCLEKKKYKIGKNGPKENKM